MLLHEAGDEIENLLSAVGERHGSIVGEQKGKSYLVPRVYTEGELP